MLKGNKMDDFIVLKMIGEGSYAKVFKVVRKLDQEIYAMKVMDISKMDKN